MIHLPVLIRQNRTQNSKANIWATTIDNVDQLFDDDIFMQHFWVGRDNEATLIAHRGGNCRVRMLTSEWSLRETKAIPVLYSQTNHKAISTSMISWITRLVIWRRSSLVLQITKSW